MQEEIAKLVNMGLNKEGVKSAFKYLDMSPDDRESFHVSYLAVLNACSGSIQQSVDEDGNEIQGDMFLHDILDQIKEYHKSKAH